MVRFEIVGLLLASLVIGMLGSAEETAAQEVKALYVFGDSYADTGNHDPLSPNASIYQPWRAPYGYSWPGVPSGRYSDGHVFTDFFAFYMGVAKPIPFRLLNIIMTRATKEMPSYEGYAKARVKASGGGINFAFGGSGVFTTLDPLVPNVTTQIQHFSTTIDLGIVNITNLPESLALFSINGNDYTAYIEQYGYTDIESFIPQVVEQMAYDLESLAELGVTNFAITNLSPVGCLPYMTSVINYTGCIEIANNWSDLHNSLLASQILNLRTKLPSSTFLTIDLNAAFNEVIEEGALSMEPCCQDCGVINETSGEPLFKVCSDAETSLYWDVMHPTNYGWHTVFKTLLPIVKEIPSLLALAYAKI